jgi:Tol biopolymer transport system component
VVAVTWIILIRHRSEPWIVGDTLSASPLTSYVGEERYPALSPDGNHVAFSWAGPDGDNVDIYVKQVGNEALLRLTDDPGFDTVPQWSPDGVSVSYFHADQRGHSIYSVPLIGGRAVELLTIQGVYAGHTWSPDGEHLAYSMSPQQGEPARVYIRNLESGYERQLTNPVESGRGDVGPTVSPNGQSIAFIRIDQVGLNELYLLPREGGVPKKLTHDALIIEGFDWTPDSERLVYSAISGASFRLYSIDLRSGRPNAIATRGEWVLFPSMARESWRLVYQDVRFNKNIWRVTRADTSIVDQQQLLASTRWDCEARYSPDGTRLAFISARSGELELWVAAADGSKPLQLTRFGGVSLGNPQWSPDGSRIAFHARPSGHADLFIIGADGGRSRRLTSGDSDHLLSSWSRDGERLYYASRVDGRWEVFCLHPDQPEASVRVTWRGAIAAVETVDGAALLLTKPDRAGLWRQSLPRNAERSQPALVRSDLPELGDWGNWAVAVGGVVMTRSSEQQGVALVWLDLKTLELETVAYAPGIARPSLAISTDGRSILYARVDQRDSDVMLVEDLR